MKENFKLSLRYFISTMAIAFLVLTVFVMYILFTNPPDGFLSVAPGGGSTVYLPSGSESMSILLTVSEKKGDAPHTVALLYFDPVGGQVPVIVIPPRCMVQEGEKTDTLERVFLQTGVRGAKQAFEQYSGITIQRYLATDNDTLGEAIDLAGRIEAEIPEKLQLENGVVINKGLQSLDGIALCQVLKTISSSEQTTSSIILSSQLISQVINAQLPLVGGTRGERVFNLLVNNSETDISYKDYEARIKAARFVSQLAGDPSYGLILQGSLNDGKNTFVFSQKSLTQLGQILEETA